MFSWNTSPFLQALGWATLNSIWQMALLWCCFLLIHHFFKLSSLRKYQLAAANIFFGFGWFVCTFIVYYINEIQPGFAIELPFVQSAEILPVVLSSASIAYLCLLIFPGYRIFQNWRFIQRIKKEGLQKATYRHRLFVQKIAQQLGIKKKVKVYLSQLVSSPVTVGFLKPVILLPFAAIANLNLQQVEAILLHELSHIRRHDYLVNLLISTIHVVLYFNPFIKLFIKRVELERENCCDEMVLQYEYDKISYASALLELEKYSQNLNLAMAAANKNHLLHRIEKIVGIKRKPGLKTAHFAGAFAGLLMLLVVNTIIIAGKEKLPVAFSINNISQPFAIFANELKDGELNNDKKHTYPLPSTHYLVKASKKAEAPVATKPPNELIMDYLPPASIPSNQFMYVAFDEVEASLNQEQKEQVEKTVENTRKVLEVQWKEVEKAIGEVMNEQEKKMAKKDYLQEIEQINWEKMEHNLKASYEELDWNKINATVAEALSVARLDSIETSCNIALSELNKIKSAESHQLAIPDVSVQQVQKTKEQIKTRLAEIKSIRAKKVVCL